MNVDYDLEACLRYNEQDFKVEDIETVLAVYEGEHDGTDWRWVLLLKNGDYVAMQGGCDYTGWDCVSSASSKRYKTIKKALGYFEPAKDNINIEPLVTTIYKNLKKQIKKQKKNKTWREIKDTEFVGYEVVEPVKKDVTIVVDRQPIELKLNTHIDKLSKAVDFIFEWGQVEGGHHKQWVVDQTLRILLGDEYDYRIGQWENDNTEPDEVQPEILIYNEWDEGIAP